MINKTSPIISFTSAAAHHIKQLIEQTPDCKGFKLGVKKGGCTGFSYVPELVKTEIQKDIKWVDEGGFSVYVDPEAVYLIKNTRLDFKDRGMGQTQLLFQNPNTKQTCGCGESFSVQETEL